MQFLMKMKGSEDEKNEEGVKCKKNVNNSVVISFKKCKKDSKTI